MRFTKRRRLLVLGGVAVLSAVFACVLAFSAGGAKAANGVTLTGTPLTLTRIGNSTAVPTGVQENDALFTCSNDTDLPTSPNCPGNSGGDDDAVPATGAGAPNVAGSALAGVLPSIPGLANFNGVSDDDSHAANGFHVTPPDQGLCVGPAGLLQNAGVPLAVSPWTSVIVEPVNDAWSVYSTNGTKLFGPESLADLFDDPGATGDVSCNYDPAARTFYFTEIGVLLSGPDADNYGTDLAVISPRGYAPYQVDTSVGANCFPDFPQNGFDNNAFYLTINEFCGPDEDFAGANLYGLSKTQLASLSSSVNGVVFGPLSLNGDPVLSLRPARGDGTSIEYLLNSVPYDASGNSTNSNTLGFWRVYGDAFLNNGGSPVRLWGMSTRSEPYAFPIPAASTGDGSTPTGSPSYVIKEPYLNPDDSRLTQLQYHGGGSPRLYAALNSAMTIGSDPTVVDGAAWFEVDPYTGLVTRQGYVGVAGTNLLYPSIVHSNSWNTLMMGFSMTSPTMNPSTGYAISTNGGSSFGPVETTATGSGPHASFADVLFDEFRWGDYSAIAFDPSNGNVWMADEYTVPTAAPPIDNWGTRVWGLNP
jgi:hypothetical protein